MRCSQAPLGLCFLCSLPCEPNPGTGKFANLRKGSVP
jgi:hypothetical protein